MTYEDFRIDTLKANKKKHHFEIRDSYGTKDAYRWCIKNRLINKSLSEKDFRIIINTLNQSFQDQLLQGKEAKLPASMGRIEVRKFNTFVGLEEGRIRTNRAVDWDRTLRLWYEDEESREAKTLVRCETDEKFKFYYNKKTATYNNKIFYDFTPARSLKLKLKELIDKQGFDALLIGKCYGLY